MEENGDEGPYDRRNGGTEYWKKVDVHEQGKWSIEGRSRGSEMKWSIVQTGGVVREQIDKEMNKLRIGSTNRQSSKTLEKRNGGIRRVWRTNRQRDGEIQGRKGDVMEGRKKKKLETEM